MIAIENAEHYEWGEGCEGWHLVKTPELSVIQERVPPGGSEQRHSHRHAQQFFFVLSGIATLEVDGLSYDLAVHQGMHVPVGTPHQLMNKSTVDLVFTVTSTPPSHGDRVGC